MSQRTTDTIRICMLIWHFHPAVGGAEQQCLKLSRDLAKRRIQVAVITMRMPGAPPMESLDGITIHRVACLSGFRARTLAVFSAWIPQGANEASRAPGIPRLRRLLAKLRNALAERLPRYAFMASAYWKLYSLRNRIDIVHIHEGHWIASLGARFAARNGKQAVIKEASSGDYLRLNFSTQLWPAATRRADVFIAISKRIARDLNEAGVESSRIRVIPNGVALPERSWTVPAGPDRNVLFVGNLSQQPYKGIDVLLRAWRMVRDKGLQARLIIVGGGDGTELKALSGELGLRESVVFQGASKDVERFMLGASAYVLPSRIEGMSNSLLEAMALGLPVVSTRISGSEDLILSGENGMLVPSENPAEMADAIAHLLENPASAAEMGRKARRTIEDGYTIRAVADRYEDLYHSMLDREGPGGKREYAR